MTVVTRDMSIKPYWKKYLQFDHTRKRMILEMTHIASNPDTINQRTDTDNLSVFIIILFLSSLWSQQISLYFPQKIFLNIGAFLKIFKINK